MCGLVVAMTGQSEKLVCGKSVEKAQRIQGGKYLDTNGKIAIWNGKVWKCEHGRQRHTCKQCVGSSLCKHGKRRSRCKECGGASICEHGKERSQCKECKARKDLAFQPLTDANLVLGDAAGDTAMSLALPPR